ncbi:7-deoxyloganetin glucosyltransferase-like [Tripterygium wilfordii]|uniref:7-deoxyloganetin glucosyltransferase-like n=1 Tax=Tripterygium wilfordii TaxID=458696 RepID=UPI0018F7EF49|nr:7-deoxyloganetin glucosyltransferase-like [Tripterygium wilfordii]
MGSMEASKKKKPHAVVIPFPLQGHINPTLKLAKLLHYKGFHITFVNTEFNHKRLAKSRGPEALQGLPDFCFETIPDGLPLTNLDSSQHVPSLVDSTRKNCLLPFRNLVLRLNENATMPPVSCIVSSGLMSFTVEVSEELGIPNVFFWTYNASSFMGFTKFFDLMERGVSSFKDESYLNNGYLENTSIEWIPGKKNIRLRDLPSFIRTADPNDLFLNFFKVEVERAQRATAIILHTFDELENEVLDILKPKFPPIFTIAPLHLLLSQIPESSSLNSIEFNLWKEEPECLKWLDTKEPNSVIYVNFGSITVITPQQLLEFAWGLANSKQNFLWIVRPDLIMGEKAILPQEFKTDTEGRGFLAGWCPQEKVLKHPSIGGFLTHSGWNSMLESISSGVPMLCWPFFSDQPTNSMRACSDWGVAEEINNDVKRDEVEKLVRGLMQGQKGSEMRKKAMELKVKAEEAVCSNGSSLLNLEHLVHEALLSKDD